jgi:hypothetical protein
MRPAKKAAYMRPLLTAGAGLYPGPFFCFAPTCGARYNLAPAHLFLPTRKDIANKFPAELIYRVKRQKDPDKFFDPPLDEFFHIISRLSV